MAIGDGAELFVTGTLGVRFDDNVFLASDKTDDIIFDLNPGLELTFGKNAQLKGALTLVDAFAIYTDNDGLGSNLFSGDFVTRFDDGKMKLDFNVGYHELNQNTPDIRGLTRRDVFSAGGHGEVEISQLTAIGAGVSYVNEDYKRSGYTDSESLSIPVDLFYKWTPKVDLSVGYRYRDYQVDLGQDSTDHYFNVGARGEFSPKFTGRFTVGYGQRDLDRGGDESMLGLDASFAYEISPKTNLQFGASNDFGTSPQGEQQKNFTLNGLVTSKVSDDWSLNAGLSFRSIDYPRRTDDYWEFQLGTSYIINVNARIVAAYVYRDYSSELRGADFKNNVFSVAAQFRY
ncbi:MAG: outer membrane beta-barrel protein [Opitutaceae bacterium]|nr:outer membrane beta-barrel protein [Opitutaceae bacterium]